MLCNRANRRTTEEVFPCSRGDRLRECADDAESAKECGWALIVTSVPRLEFELDWSRSNRSLLRELASVLQNSLGLGFGSRVNPRIIDNEVFCAPERGQGVPGPIHGEENPGDDHSEDDDALANSRDGKSTAADHDEVVANRRARFFVTGAKRILDEALASLADLHEERIRLDTMDGHADMGLPTELRYTDEN